jgi:raffinose/stachyose/melibiose transport system permease protein
MRHKANDSFGTYPISIFFILPTLLLFLPLVILPIFDTIITSFFAWDGVSPSRQFVGIANYFHAFNEPRFIRSLVNTGIWVILHMALACGTALLLAFYIMRIQLGKTLFRTLLFLPNVIALSISAVIWGMMYSPTFGVVNSVLKVIGLSHLAVSWLGDPNLALYAISIASAWQAYGYYMVLFIAGLQNIDQSMYEAAYIDGANSRQLFIYVTIPMLGSILTFVLSMAIINGLKGFATVWAMTQGGPEYSTYLLTLYIFKTAFGEYNFGLAMTGGVVLGGLIVLITVVFNRLRTKVISS